ncbi:hypothetical protein KUCAC02_023662 [Chaenocephalus aceratus]|uniref:Uncharacterized protein n=1 Tax=Chaenocephalus aceratus TaxID=36190 RepID=A0ACB9WFK1_CHAAC|nr:hypothetical protein KUCAC02_023662 [Chaenocephalus aceratus]
MEPRQIREGYLVKKGTLLNSWKAVWVVLSEDGVEFYKKKTDSSPKGMIPLKGATLISPCQDFGKRMLVFKITTGFTCGGERILGEGHEESHYLPRGGKKFARKSTRRSIRLPDKVNLTELYTLMKDQDDGVKELKLEQENRVFNHCFTGATVVEWLISKEKARNTAEALMLATGLLNEGFLQPAGDLSKEGAESGEQSVFLDQTTALYYFADSGFFCEGYSSDEDVLLKQEFRGNIIKQGCLLKQGHKRKNWKTTLPMCIIMTLQRGMTLWAPFISVGLFITAVEHVPDAKKYDIDGNLFEIITSDETHYFLQAATAEERKEWIKAIQAVSKSGK